VYSVGIVDAQCVQGSGASARASREGG
jgi:hypothetical protein